MENRRNWDTGGMRKLGHDNVTRNGCGGPLSPPRVFEHSVDFGTGTLQCRF